MKKIHRLYFLTTLTVMAVCFFSIILANYVLDPFQVYRESLINKGRYLQDQERFQNAGLIHQEWLANSCCTSFLLGTSHSQNFDGEKLGHIFKNGPVLNLAMSGGAPAEHLYLFKYASGLRMPQTVFWELHTGYTDPVFKKLNEGNVSPGKFFPDYLYDQTVWNDASYLASVDTLSFGLKQAASKLTLAEHKEWYTRNLPSFGIGNRVFEKNLPLYIQKPDVKVYEEGHAETISATLASIVSAHQDTKFIFFFPPYSLHFYANMKPEEYTKFMQMRVDMVAAISPYKNASIHDLTLLVPGTDDLNLYKDTAHYHPDIGYAVMKQIAAHKGMLTRSNLTKQVKTLTERVNRYCLKNKQNCILKE